MSCNFILLGFDYHITHMRDLTFKFECLCLFLLCGFMDIIIWRAHWYMTYEDAGFINNVPSVVEASKMSNEDFTKHVEDIIKKITGLETDSDYWPALMIKRCGRCKMLKTS